MIHVVCESDRILVPERVVDLPSFRSWTDDVAFPESGRVCFLKGEVWIDTSKEQLFSHDQVKMMIAHCLIGLALATREGRYFGDGAFVSNVEADVSNQPDGCFVSVKSLEADRVRLVEGKTGGPRRTRRLAGCGAGGGQRQFRGEGYGGPASGICRRRHPRVLAGGCTRNAAELRDFSPDQTRVLGRPESRRMGSIRGVRSMVPAGPGAETRRIPRRPDGIETGEARVIERGGFFSDFRNSRAEGAVRVLYDEETRPDA